MRTFQTAALAVTLSLVLTACAQPAVPTPAPTPSPTPTSTPSPLDTLRQEAKAAGCLCAVAYVGYSETGTAEAVREGAAVEGLTETYPFLTDIPDQQVVLADMGWDVYCILPTDPGAQMTVTALGITEDGQESVGDTLYQGGGEPILLWCNISDIMRNSRVTVTSGEESVQFSPYLSLKDGSPSTTAPEGTVYLFGT